MTSSMGKIGIGSNNIPVVFFQPVFIKPYVFLMLSLNFAWNVQRVLIKSTLFPHYWNSEHIHFYETYEIITSMPYSTDCLRTKTIYNINQESQST